MQSEADAVRIEQHSTNQAVGSGDAGSRRMLLWAQTDLWGLQEMSVTRRLIAWAALAITFAVALLLAMGY
jgi:hypothetical protein